MKLLCVSSCFVSLPCLCFCKYFGSYIAVVEVSVVRSNSISLDNWLPNFADDIVVLSSWVDVSLYSFCTLRPLKMGPLHQEPSDGTSHSRRLEIQCL